MSEDSTKEADVCAEEEMKQDDGNYLDEKVDVEISVEDLFPLQLGRQQNDTTDAKSEKPPKLPPKKGIVYNDIPPRPESDDETSPTSEATNIHSAGSILQLDIAEETRNSDKEVKIEDILSDVEVHKIMPSESVKAFFGQAQDQVDAAIDKKCPIPTFEYDMTHKHRGVFVIFNQINFQDHLQMNKRTGTSRDAENLEETAHVLGFDYVRTFHDYPVRKILKMIKALSEADHSNYDCFALAILTHGETGDILYGYDNTFHLDELVEPFTAKNCESLAGKPKLFFIQACRGTKLDEGVQIGDMVDAKVVDIAYKTEKEIAIIPNSADFLLAFSTVPGFYAWRNQCSGSWFVQALCKCLREFGDRLELMQIMTRVNRMVAYDFISYSKSNLMYHGKKQIPSIVTRLTHEVFFRDKRVEVQQRRCPSPRQKTRASHVTSEQNNLSSKEDVRTGLLETNV